MTLQPKQPPPLGVQQARKEASVKQTDILSGAKLKYETTRPRKKRIRGETVFLVDRRALKHFYHRPFLTRCRVQLGRIFNSHRRRY